MQKKTLSNVLEFLQAVTVKQELILNPDKEQVKTVAIGLMENYNAFGYFCCPCRESWEDRKKDRDITCPCAYCKPDIEEYGQCYCGLFVSEDVSVDGRELSSIPDRRDDDLYPD